MQTALDYLRLHLDTGFVRDADGLLLRVNETSNVNAIPPAPLVFFGRTPIGNVWTYHADLPDSLRHDMEQLLTAEPILAAYERPPACREALVRLLAEHASVRDEEAGPAYHFPANIVAPSDAMAVTAANSRVLQEHYPDVLADLDTSLPCVAVLDEGQAVSVCFSARTGARAAEAGVVTLPAARGRGYAAAATAGWAAAVRERGLVPLYSTDWDNLSSRAIARRLGLIMYAGIWSLSSADRRAKNHP